MATLSASELILNADGSVYHLNLLPDELADKIIFVGDPERAPKVAAHFDRIQVEKRKREFYTITGELEGERISVIATGIGTDNIDIVMTELDMLANADLGMRELKAEHKQLKILRLGTCGGLQPPDDPGTFVFSSFAVGLDGLMHWYDRPDPEPGLTSALDAFAGFKWPVRPYTAKAGKYFSDIAAKFAQIKSGITFTASGFYGPQGRYLQRLAPAVRNLPDKVSNFEYDGVKARNFEMETAAILGLGAALGHEAGSLSVIIANRAKQTFAADPAAAERALIELGIQVMTQAF